MLSKTGDTVVLDTRFLSLTTLPGPEFDWEGKIKLVGKEVLYAFLSKIYFLRESGNITLTIDNYGSGTWWPLKYVRISLQPGGYLIYDRYHEPIDFEGLRVNKHEYLLYE